MILQKRSVARKLLATLFFCVLVAHQDLSKLDKASFDRYYTGANAGDFHTAYYALVTKAYIVEE